MADKDLLEPAKKYRLELKNAHHERVVTYFDDLTKKAGTDVAANKSTCDRIRAKVKERDKIQKKINSGIWLAILFGILCLIIVGIFLFIYVYRPRQKRLKAELDKVNKEIERLEQEAWAQMASLNALFDSEVPFRLFSQTCPLIQMDRNFDIAKFEQLISQYGMWSNTDQDRSTLNLQSGSILGNPFVFFKDIVMKMCPHTYQGSLTITWTERVRGEKGYYTVVRTQTLVATVTKPKPEYSHETYLVYACDAAPHLTFHRGPSEMRGMDEKKREHYVKKHEKDLFKYAQSQMGKGGTYTPLGNAEFELSFGGLNRNNEVEYRLLFTPLAQKAMIDVLFSPEGYGDDFFFKKDKYINIVESGHAAGTAIFLESRDFRGYDYEAVRKFFIDYNDNFFKSIYFDFAPLMAIPLYQQMKSHEYIYKNTIKSWSTPFEHEVMANRFDPRNFAHKDTVTDVILKTNFMNKVGNEDNVKVTGHSFRSVAHVELVPKLGGDGRMHNVPVTWYEYIPLTSDGFIQVGNVGGDERQFTNFGLEHVIYRKGLVAHTANLNVDINSLKSQMAKKEN